MTNTQNEPGAIFTHDELIALARCYHNLDYNFYDYQWGEQNFLFFTFQALSSFHKQFNAKFGRNISFEEAREISTSALSQALFRNDENSTEILEELMLAQSNTDLLELTHQKVPSLFHNTKILEKGLKDFVYKEMFIEFLLEQLPSNNDRHWLEFLTKKATCLPHYVVAYSPALTQLKSSIQDINHSDIIHPQIKEHLEAWDALQGGIFDRKSECAESNQMLLELFGISNSSLSEHGH